MSIAGVASSGYPKDTKNRGLPSKVRRHRHDFLKFVSEVDTALGEIQHKLNLLATHVMLPDEDPGKAGDE